MGDQLVFWSPEEKFLLALVAYQYFRYIILSITTESKVFYALSLRSSFACEQHKYYLSNNIDITLLTKRTPSRPIQVIHDTP
jgi:hypothetical protein